MSTDPKECVLQFYTSDYYKKAEAVKQYLHPEAELYWNSSAGFHKLKFDEVKNLSRKLADAFDSLRAEVSHLLRDGDHVTIRFTYYVRTMENPDEELPMAHFMAIWKLRDGKMYKGHQISLQADDSPGSLDSFVPINGV